MTATALEIRPLRLSEIHPSKTNPRQNVKGAGFDDLVASVKAHGILEPILVRKSQGIANAANGQPFEVVFGHRRFAAAQAAGLETVPSIIRELDDTQALEIQIVENLARADFHPLEEADAYHRLSRQPGYDVAKVAARVGRSAKYIYDRMKLLSLAKDVQALFLADRITAGHAILLARLSPKDQARATKDDVLFEHESLLFDPNDSSAARGAHKALKAISVRELEAWIDEHVRFEQRDADPMLFPETNQRLSQAAVDAEKIFPITHSHHVPSDARGGLDQRTWGPNAWKRADGAHGSKTCDHSAMGFIVVGFDRGNSFRVCVAKEKCKVHWPAEFKRASEKAAKSPKGAAPSKGKLKETDQERYKRENAEQAERAKEARAVSARWDKARPQILAAVAEAVKGSSAVPGSKLAAILVRGVTHYSSEDKAAMKHVPLGKTEADLVRHAAFITLIADLADWRAPKDFPAIAKSIGVDVGKILDEVAPVQTTAKAETPKKPAAKLRGKKK